MQRASEKRLPQGVYKVGLDSDGKITLEPARRLLAKGLSGERLEVKKNEYGGLDFTIRGAVEASETAEAGPRCRLIVTEDADGVEIVSCSQGCIPVWEDSGEISTMRCIPS